MDFSNELMRLTVLCTSYTTLSKTDHSVVVCPNVED